MTDRVQPGAIDSIARNDELAQVLAQFSEGWLKPGSEPPTAAAVRRPEIDESALSGFSLVSTSGFVVTIDAGEGFVAGWCARDVQTSVTVPANTTATVVLAWSLDAIFDPVSDPTRDLADKIEIGLDQNIDSQYPRTELFDVETDGTGIISTTDRRRLGPTVATETADVGEALELPVFQSLSDVPTTLPEGTIVYIKDKQQVFIENGN
jgi:hypothetical protein